MLKTNPIANLADVGYYKLNQQMLQADLRLIQDLSVLTRGLGAGLAITYDNNATYQEAKPRKAFMYQTIEERYRRRTGLYELRKSNGELEISNKGLANQYIHTNFGSEVNYHRTWDKHRFCYNCHDSPGINEALTGTNISRFANIIR